MTIMKFSVNCCNHRKVSICLSNLLSFVNTITKKNKWISKGIIKSIEVKDKLYKLMIQHTIDDVEAHQYIKNTFDIYRNMLKKLIR